ncbi:hypothetical protein NQZ68_016776 [Dissostichus eleginoides]|nr:hypothetical protein NQZ68_016776 [Dissostichus eleginoides]
MVEMEASARGKPNHRLDFTSPVSPINAQSGWQLGLQGGGLRKIKIPSACDLHPGDFDKGQQEVKCLDSGLLMLFSLLIKSQVTDLIQERLWAAEESTGSSSAQQRDQVTLYSATGGASVPPCSCPGCVYPWPPDR